MVFCRLGYSLYLIFGEPLAEFCKSPYDSAAFKMMRLAIYFQAKVVACGRGKEHVCIYIVPLSHFKGTVYDSVCMVFPVRFVIGSVAGNDAGLYVFYKRTVHTCPQYFLPGMNSDTCLQ